MFILHIGSHKAGSSTIQKFLAQNAGKLRQHEILYPDLGRGSGRGNSAHHELKSQIRGDPLANTSCGTWDDLVALERDNPEKKILVSSEGLESLRMSEIIELRRRLGEAPTKILVYLRDFAGQLPSRYNQSTKKGHNWRNFDEFYETFSPSKIKRPVEVFENWASVFGWENLRIRTLDSRSLSGGTLIDDLLVVLGVTLADLGGSEAKGLAPLNASYGWKTTELLRALYSRIDVEVGRDSRSPYRIRRDVASALENTCVEVMNQLSLGAEQTQYLTIRQREECHAAWAWEIEKLNRLVVGPKLPLPDIDQDKAERPFLPSIAHIPADQRVEIARCLSEKLFLEKNRGEERKRGLASAAMALVRTAFLKEKLSEKQKQPQRLEERSKRLASVATAIVGAVIELETVAREDTALLDRQGL